MNLRIWMKKNLILVILISIIGCSLPIFAAAPIDNLNATPADEVSKWSWLESAFQVGSIGSTYIRGNSGDENVLGIHFRPAWQWKRFEGRLDFAFYKNPWYQGSWQWGEPIPGVKPGWPNFIHSFAYHGEWLDLSYQEITDINFGHGLIISEYHPTNPYHGWLVRITPTASTKVTFISSQELLYIYPHLSDDFASLQVFRLDQSLEMLGLKLQLGVTGVNDHSPDLNPAEYPVLGGEYDITLANLIWLAPFYETADYDNFGGADMFGVKGKLGLFSYQFGGFKSGGDFSPNYMGGRYEDFKWNTVNTGNKYGLPIPGNGSRDGFIGRLGVEVSPWLKLSFLYIDDITNTTGASLSGKIERLKLEYGAFYYNVRDFYNYDWFLKGGYGYFGYEYHYYVDWDSHSHSNFEVSYKF